MLRIALVAIGAVAGLGIAEGTARVVWKGKYNRWLAGQLHGYDELDRKRSLNIPKANLKATVAQLRADLLAHGKTIGLAQFEDLVDELNLSESDVILTVNSLAFRGSEFVLPKPEGVYRVLAIGDSCTWGPPVDEFTYPSMLERQLAPWMADDCKRTLEVVNAGVPGYNFDRVLMRVGEFLAVEPDLVTIYLGWNRTIGRADLRKNQGLYRQLALYRFYYHAVVNRNETGLTEDFQQTTYFDPHDPDVAALARYDFSRDLRDLEELVHHFSDRRIPVVIVTLAGMLDWRVEPDRRALELAYPISSTRNLYAYPLLTRLYNDQLRMFAELEKLPLVDFEEFAYEHFSKRSEYFTDSVHMTLKGYESMGKFLADELRSIVVCDTSQQDPLTMDETRQEVGPFR